MNAQQLRKKFNKMMAETSDEQLISEFEKLGYTQINENLSLENPQRQNESSMPDPPLHESGNTRTTARSSTDSVSAASSGVD